MIARDGRNLDRRIAGLRGEGAALAAGSSGEAAPVAAPDTYYDLPVVKPAPWRWYVPVYFHAGGLAGYTRSRRSARPRARCA